MVFETMLAIFNFGSSDTSTAFLRYCNKKASAFGYILLLSFSQNFTVMIKMTKTQHTGTKAMAVVYRNLR